MYDDALAGFERTLGRWQKKRCVVEGEKIVRRNLAEMGAEGVDPLTPEGCAVWLGVVRGGSPIWLRLASQRLFACGGPWIEFPVQGANSAATKDLKLRLLAWYEPLFASTADSSKQP